MINKILDAYHKRANLKIICNISKYLSNDKQSLIKKCHNFVILQNFSCIIH